MSEQSFFIGVSSFVLAVLTAIPASAQLPPGTTERAEIPFAFIVRGRTMSAGTYSIRRINDSSEALLIENRNLRSHVAFQTEPFQSREAPKRSELVFHRYGDTYFLREIRTGGDREGRELATSRAERALQNESAGNVMTAPETVAIQMH